MPGLRPGTRQGSALDPPGADVRPRIPQFVRPGSLSRTRPHFFFSRPWMIGAPRSVSTGKGRAKSPNARLPPGRKAGATPSDGESHAENRREFRPGTGGQGVHDQHAKRQGRLEDDRARRAPLPDQTRGARQSGRRASRHEDHPEPPRQRGRSALLHPERRERHSADLPGGHGPVRHPGLRARRPLRPVQPGRDLQGHERGRDRGRGLPARARRTVHPPPRNACCA